jgi:hypothetical protein
MPTFTSCGTCSSRVAAPRSELERRGESSPTPLHRAGSAAGSASLLKRAAAAAAPAAAAAAEDEEEEEEGGSDRGLKVTTWSKWPSPGEG